MTDVNRPMLEIGHNLRCSKTRIAVSFPVINNTPLPA